MMGSILITGATGFIGSDLVHFLSKQGCDVTAASRKQIDFVKCISFDLTKDNENVVEFENFDVVIHCAGLAHQQIKGKLSERQHFDEVNLNGTKKLVGLCGKSIKKFIYISSVKVHGEETFLTPFTADSAYRPEDFYAKSKVSTEQFLLEYFEDTEVDLIIIRPTLVYKETFTGNLLTIHRLLEKRVPLPFKNATFNKRSLVSVNNLIDFIYTCLCFKEKINNAFIVSDAHTRSTREVIELVARETKQNFVIFSFPIIFLKIILTISGKRRWISRLYGNLHVNTEKNYELLKWRPR